MRSFSRLFRIPRPKKFLGCVGLPLASEIIAAVLVFNKATGIYGLLAILTGYSLNALQIPTYLYCVLAIFSLVYLIPHIRKQSPFECLALAWLYIIDSFINLALTASFAMTWYVARAAEDARADDSVTSQMPLKVSSGSLSKGASSMPHDTAFSIIIIVFATLGRFYLCFVVAAFAQQCLKRHMDRVVENDDPIKQLGAPFTQDCAEGHTWRGKLARLMIGVGRSYWLDASDRDEWARSMNARFRKIADDAV
ncbi:hypothetical protein CFIMG_001212RA [Ceratocystis fimbriata CBS 114723]|uniref:Inositol phoshorylceramide synthase regulatory subunit kei1 n=1 Tax=Ceratocystis fimbriata CBS 114723 TaxID=1035309 RepID=A0A2C5XDT9_9PEZI|nr:hypothetical protein CFIMG_001212RA [Ceratocystis fimbriata CBS 114723]